MNWDFALCFLIVFLISAVCNMYQNRGFARQQVVMDLENGVNPDPVLYQTMYLEQD